MHVDFMFCIQGERVELNGKVSNEGDVTAEVLHESILGPLLFLSYINDPALGLSSDGKLFANVTFLFSVTHDINTSVTHDISTSGNELT